MDTKKLHWLEISEYSLIGMTFISLIVGGLSKNWLLPVVFLFTTLIINLINRLRWQYFQRKRLSSGLKQLQRQITSEIEALTPINPPIAPSTPPNPDSIPLATVRDSLLSIEESINNVVKYLSTHTLPERLTKLERAYTQLREEILGLEETPFDLPTEEPIKPPNPPIVSSPASSPPWQTVYTLKEHSDAVIDLCLSEDGRYLISGSWDQTIKIWELATGLLKLSLTAHSQGILATVLASNGILATGSFDQTIKLWSVDLSATDIPNPCLEHTLTAHTGSVYTFALTPDGNYLVSGSYDQTLKQWNLSTGEMVLSSYDPSGAIHAVTVHPTYPLIASGGGDGKISLWDSTTGQLVGYLSGNLSSVESLAISPDGYTLAAGCVDGHIKLWQWNREKLDLRKVINPIRTVKAHSGHVKALIFSQKEQILYSSGADGTIKLWHPNRTTAIATLSISNPEQPRFSAVHSLCLSRDEQWLIAGSADGTIKILSGR